MSLDDFNFGVLCGCIDRFRGLEKEVFRLEGVIAGAQRQLSIGLGYSGNERDFSNQISDNIAILYGGGGYGRAIGDGPFKGMLSCFEELCVERERFRDRFRDAADAADADLRYLAGSGAPELLLNGLLLLGDRLYKELEGVMLRREYIAIGPGGRGGAAGESLRQKMREVEEERLGADLRYEISLLKLAFQYHDVSEAILDVRKGSRCAVSGVDYVEWEKQSVADYAGEVVGWLRENGRGNEANEVERLREAAVLVPAVVDPGGVAPLGGVRAER